MNRTFREVADLYRRRETLTHQQRVTRMYRQILRLTKDYYFRQQWYDITEQIKAEFVANKNLDPQSGYEQLSPRVEVNLLRFCCSIAVFP